MAGFSAGRFVEGFAAALLGAYIHEKTKDGVGSGNADAIQKFQRALLVTANNAGFTEQLSIKYKQRIGLLKPRSRMRYIRLALQPDQRSFDERVTAILLLDHALQSNVEWEATIRLMGLDQPDLQDKATAAMNKSTETLSSFAGFLDNAATKLEADTKRRREERERRFTYRLAGFFNILSRNFLSLSYLFKRSR